MSKNLNVYDTDFSDFEQTKREFQAATIIDLCEGATTEELEGAIAGYSCVENYAACAGIKAAMKDWEAIKDLDADVEEC